MNTPRVFLSYNSADKEIVERIHKLLKREGIDAFSDIHQVSIGENLNNPISYFVQSSDAVIVFLSKSLNNSKWLKYEFEHFLLETKKRNVSVIPVVLDELIIPDILSDYHSINISKFEEGYKNLTHRIKALLEITFDHFSPIKFENFVGDFLMEYGFQNIQQQAINHDSGFDFKAEFDNMMPFGATKRDHWIVQVKFYKHERFSVNAIRNIFVYKRELLPPDFKLLLVTNGILTSVAQEYLQDSQKTENIQIEVVDGLRLKRLVVEKKNLLDKYFRG